MISSLRSTEVLASNPSQQSARPSRCRPPVSDTQTMRVRIPATSGGKIRSTPIHASQVNAPITIPTNGYQIEARPLSPTCHFFSAGRGIVVMRLKAVRRYFILVTTGHRWEKEIFSSAIYFISCYSRLLHRRSPSQIGSCRQLLPWICPEQHLCLHRGADPGQRGV